MDKKLTQLYSTKEVNKAIINLAFDINELCSDNLVVIMVLKGGVYLGMKLLELLSTDTPYGFIGLTSYGDDTKSSGGVQCTYKPLFDPDFFQGKDIMLVDDIFESGITLEYAKKMFANTGYRSIRGVVLVKKGKEFTCHTCLWKIGLSYEGDKFIVGCGAGHGEKHRNLSCIYEEKEKQNEG